MKMKVGDIISWSIHVGTPPNTMKKQHTGILIEIVKNLMGGKVNIMRVLVDGEIIELSSKNTTLVKVEENG